jgi:hypothetical protein
VSRLRLSEAIPLHPYTPSWLAHGQLCLHFTFHIYIYIWRSSPQWARASSFMRFPDYTQRHTILTADRHTCLRWDSKPQSQQSSGCRPTSLKHQHAQRYMQSLLSSCSLQNDDELLQSTARCTFCFSSTSMCLLSLLHKFPQIMRSPKEQITIGIV